MSRMAMRGASRRWFHGLSEPRRREGSLWQFAELYPHDRCTFGAYVYFNKVGPSRKATPGNPMP